MSSLDVEGNTVQEFPDKTVLHDLSFVFQLLYSLSLTTVDDRHPLDSRQVVQDNKKGEEDESSKDEGQENPNLLEQQVTRSTRTFLFNLSFHSIVFN